MDLGVEEYLLNFIFISNLFMRFIARFIIYF